MIAVDTNTIAYLYLPTQYTADVEALLVKDSEWVAPLLWRSEFRNILSLYVRQGIIDMGSALQMQAQAERLLAGNEYSVNSASVLALANESDCSAYDSEFVSVAKSLNVKLITADRKLIAAFPGVAMMVSEYLRS